MMYDLIFAELIHKKICGFKNYASVVVHLLSLSTFCGSSSNRAVNQLEERRLRACPLIG